mgnify:CR=1 FL=1
MRNISLKIMSFIFVGCAFFLWSCEKEIIEPVQQEQVVKEQKWDSIEEFEMYADRAYQIIHSSGIEELETMSYEDVAYTMKNGRQMNECFNSNDLLSFLAEYGASAPDYIPAWNNYFQDANCNVAQWQYFGKERGEEGTAVNTTIIPDQVIWNVSGEEFAATTTDGTLKFTTYIIEGNDTIPNINCEGNFQPPCNGGHAVTVTVIIGDAVYQRSNISWGQVNNVPESIAPDCTEYSSFDVTNSSTFDFDCFCPIVFDEYQYLIDDGLTWDLNGDHVVNASDLLIFIANYGNC